MDVAEEQSAQPIGLNQSSDATVTRAYYDNGRLGCECPVVNGILHGVQQAWHYNGVLSYECQWVNGEQRGVEKRWNRDGTFDCETPLTYYKK